MLNRQYGIAASSAIVKVAHAEDSQPNERIQSRNRTLPPKLNTVRPPRFPSNSSRLGTQLARRGSWNSRIHTKPRQQSSPWSNPGPSPPPPSSSWTARYRSLSPKLPLEPIRRRTPLDAPRYQPPDRPPLPGRKRKPTQLPPSEPPPPQKLKIDHPSSPPPDPIKQEPSSPEPIQPLRRLVNEACSFWPIPDNCQKSCSDYPTNRRQFAKAKNKELVNLGLKRTRVFFREDGLVIEWKSQVPVWNDTLLPESSETFPSHNPEILKRKRDIIEIIDVDALPTTETTTTSTPSKKFRPSNPEPEPEPKTPSPPKQKKIPARHWSAGLSKDDIRKLGRTVEASSSSSKPSLPTPPNSCDKKSSAPLTPVFSSSPPKRLALPTRLTPFERKVVSDAAYASRLRVFSSSSSSPERDKEARLSTTTLEIVLGDVLPQSPTTNKVDAEVVLLEEGGGGERQIEMATDICVDAALPKVEDDEERCDSGLGMVVEGMKPEMAHVDAFALSKGDKERCDSGLEGMKLEMAHVDAFALSKGGEERQLGCDSGLGLTVEETNSEMTTDAHVDAALPKVDEERCDSGPEPTIKGGGGGKSRNLNPDEAALFEAESQEIERLCMEDHSLDFPEYDMAEDFLRRFISSFDTDRNELEMAYSNDALLSFREPASTDELSSSSKSTLHLGRTEIIDKLKNCLVGYHLSSSSSSSSSSSPQAVGVGDDNAINFDIAVLSREVLDCTGTSTTSGDDGPSAIDKETVGGVLATLHSQILLRSGSGSGSGKDHGMMTLHQSFVLRRRMECDDESISWPLVVISHHMVLRDVLPPSLVQL